MDNIDINEPFFTADFGKDIAKSLIINAAASVGIFGGMIVVGLIAEKIQARKIKKSEKKTDIVK